MLKQVRKSKKKSTGQMPGKKKYPILLQYQANVNIPNYAHRINVMLDELKQEYNFSEQDAMLVLKDILYNVWKNRKNK